jgi:hypothetical protein
LGFAANSDCHKKKKAERRKKRKSLTGFVENSHPEWRQEDEAE